MQNRRAVWPTAMTILAFLLTSVGQAKAQFADPKLVESNVTSLSPASKAISGDTTSPNRMTDQFNFDYPGYDSVSSDSYQFDPGEYKSTGTSSEPPAFWQRIVSDHRNFYDLHSFRLLAGGFLIGAAVANTKLDQELQDHFQSSVRGATSDDWSEFLHADKELGNGLYSLPIFATAWAAGAYFDESPVLVTTGRWGERSLRSFLVGAPPLILAQRLTGGSRPNEKARNSRWLPFQDNNGVSGHAFMSSLPFINAAKMTDRPFLKTAFYAGSLLGPLSRVNDNAHYPSQIALGWWIAYVAATAIDRTEMANGNLTFYPYMANNGATGGMLEWRF